MKKITLFVLCIIISYSAFSQQIWKKELEESPNTIEFLDKDSKLFIAAKDYLYLFDTETGKSVYELELDDYLEEGIYQLVGTTFLVAPDDETLLAIDALTGKEKWRKQYTDVDQGDYTGLYDFGGKSVMQYGSSLHIAIDLNTGSPLWTNNFEYNGDISAIGGWNYTQFESRNSFLVISPDDMAYLINADNGKAYGSIANFEPNESIIKAGLDWSFTDKNENYILFTLDDDLIAIDIKTGKEAFRTPMDWDDEIQPFIRVQGGVIILSEDKVLYFDTENGRSSSIKLPVDDFRTYEVYYSGNDAYLFAGFKNKLVAINLNDGRIMWETKEGDEAFKGYPHRYMELRNGQLVMTYVYGENPPNGGTWIRAVGVDAATGKVNFQTSPLLLSEIYINSFTRAISSIASDPNGFSKYDNLGFDYYSQIVGDKLVLSISSPATTLNPTNREEGGDGVVIVDVKSGKVLLADYNELNDYGNAGVMPIARVESKMIGDKLLMCGNIRAALYDIKQAKRIWLTEPYEERYIVDVALLDNKLYMKYGFLDFSIVLSPPGLIGWFGASIEVKENMEEDPHGVMSFDYNSGKLDWNTELDQDPAFATPNFSLAGYYSSKNKSILYSDEENLYSLGPDGKYLWTKNYDDLGVGSIPYDKIYAVSEQLLGSDYTTTSTYSGYNYDWKVTTTHTSTDADGISKFVDQMGTSDASIVYKSGNSYWGASAKKTLGLYVGGDDALILGSSGISRLDRYTGNPKWKLEWDYSPDEVEMTPTFLGERLVFCFSELLQVIDYSAGKLVWSAEESSDAKFIISPTGKFVFSIDQEDIAGYKVN